MSQKIDNINIENLKFKNRNLLTKFRFLQKIEAFGKKLKRESKKLKKLKTFGK